MDSIIERFDAIRWHDSKLLGLCFYRTEQEEQVKVSLVLLGEGTAMTPAEGTFIDCVYVEAEVYLEAKRMCSDDISSAECYISSDWKKAVSEPGLYDVIRGDRRFEPYLRFRITMCPPGGTINILAKGFALESTVSK
jgi:hypothetical protein